MTSPLHAHTHPHLSLTSLPRALLPKARASFLFLSGLQPCLQPNKKWKHTEASKSTLRLPPWGTQDSCIPAPNRTPSAILMPSCKHACWGQVAAGQGHYLFIVIVMALKYSYQPPLISFTLRTTWEEAPISITIAGKALPSHLVLL